MGPVGPISKSWMTGDRCQSLRRIATKRQIDLHRRDKLAVVEPFGPIDASRRRALMARRQAVAPMWRRTADRTS
jgi:hypothetical protein